MMYARSEMLTLCEKLTADRLERWIQDGWISPQHESKKTVFDDLDRARANLICHLIDDLELQEDSMPVVLSLMDQVYSMREDMRRLAAAIDQQPEAVRTEIAINLKTRPNST